MRNTLILATFLAALAVMQAVPARAADGRVELNLSIAKGAPLTGPQKWLPILSDVGFDSTRISNEVPENPLQITKGGTDASPVWLVNGILTAGGDVMLPPGRRFSQRDKAGLRQWVTALKTQGAQATGGRKLPFGLTKDQFETTHKDLRVAVTATTKGTDPVATLTAITRGLANKVVLDDTSRQALAESGAVRDELKGVAIGTALAALVRPAGLVLRPRVSAGRIEYLIADGSSKGDNWPVGWKSKEAIGRLVPKMLESEDTQDAEVPLAAALDEFQGRVGVPFVFDYNGLAAAGIELAETQVKMKARRSTYASILSGLLVQAKLTFEGRQDDAGRPFLWIGTIQEQ